MTFEEIARALADLDSFADGTWCRFRYSLLTFLSAAEAIVFSHLANIYVMRVKFQQTRHGWTKLSTREVVGYLPWSRAKVENQIRSLESRGVVKSARSGKGGKRYFRIDNLRFKEFSQSQVVRNRDIIDSRLYEIETSQPAGCTKSRHHRLLKPPRKVLYLAKPKEIDPPVRTREEENAFKIKTLSPPPVGDSLIGLGSILAEGVSHAQPGRKIAGRVPRQWGQEIQKVHTLDGYDSALVEEVVRWYCRVLKREGDINSNGNPRRYKIAYSGRAFRDKFDELQGRMKRDRAAGLDRGGPKAEKRIRTVYLDEADNEGED